MVPPKLRCFSTLMTKKTDKGNEVHTWHHIWELPGNYPLFTVVMVIYHYIERNWRVLVTPNFCIKYRTINKYFPGEPVNLNTHLLINMIQDSKRYITTKKG